MTSFLTHPPQKSGVPLGAIGAGSLELWPDGEFHAWQIANPKRFCRDCRKLPDADDGESLTGSLSFFLRTETDGDVLLRRLGFGSDNNERMYAFLKPVETIGYEGTFPTVQLTYRDRALPVSVSMEAACPFVPHDSMTAGIPGILVTFTLHNCTDKPVRAALTGKLKSIFASQPHTRCALQQTGSYTGITLSGGVPDAPDCGSYALSAMGRSPSWIIGAYRGYLDECVAHGELGVSEESFLFDLYRNGRLPNLIHHRRIDPDLLAVDPDALSDAACRDLLTVLSDRPLAASMLERLRLGAPDQTNDPGFLRATLRYLLKNLCEQNEGVWGDSALCTEIELAPDETATIPFLLTWYFPNLYSASGNRVGHWYETRFSDAWDVNLTLQANRERILQSVRAFRDTLHDDRLPAAVRDAVSIHLSTLVKSAWWAKNGDFGVWEGLGSCGLCTTDISYHGTWGLIALFPDLQLRQMHMTSAHIRADGAVPHFFSPDFSSTDDGFDRVDLNPQFVLLVCRDWLATGDASYLKKMWPHVCAAMNHTQSLDQNGDGLPDTNAGRNTYDAWRFSGTSTYVSVLWLAALKAAIRMADDLNETDASAKWGTLLQTGTDAIEGMLWNGAYYDLWHDGDARDECCMTDQLDGDCFCRMLGLGSVLPDAHVHAALETILQLNFSTEGGLTNAGCPDGKRATLYTFRNCQGAANWSGVEYWFAAYLFRLGLYEQGMRIVETVQERYRRLGLIWNHAECGDFYYRPLSSFALPNALSGFGYDAPKHTLRFSAAPQKMFFVPWFTPSAYGTLSGTSTNRTLIVVSGSLSVNRLFLPDDTAPEAVFKNDVPIPFARLRMTNGAGTQMEPCVLAATDTLTVSFAR